MVSYGDASKTWQQTDSLVLTLGTSDKLHLPDLAGIGSRQVGSIDSWQGVPPRVGCILQAWGSGTKGAVQFLPGANGPGGLAHGGAILTAVVDACIAKTGKEPISLDLALKRPVPLLQSMLIIVEPTSTTGCQVRLEDSKGTIVATSKVQTSARIASYRSDDDMLKVVEYTELGEISILPVPELSLPAWLAELRSGGAVLVPASVHTTPYKPGGPFWCYLNGRMLTEVWALQGSVVGVVAFGRACEGSPGLVHTGAVSSALDNLFVLLCHKVLNDAPMSAAVAVTANFSMEMVHDVPLDVTFRMEASVVRIQSKGGKHKVHMEASLRGGAGDAEVFASASSLFIGKGPLSENFCQLPGDAKL